MATPFRTRVNARVNDGTPVWTNNTGRIFCVKETIIVRHDGFGGYYSFGIGGLAWLWLNKYMPNQCSVIYANEYSLNPGDSIIFIANNGTFHAHMSGVLE